MVSTTIAETPQPAPTAQTNPWVEGSIILAAFAYLVTTFAPKLFDLWTKQSHAESEADITREQVTLSTVLTTLTKMQDALLLQQNTLIASLLSSNQVAKEEEDIVTALKAQNETLIKLIQNQEVMLQYLKGINNEPTER